MRYQKGTFTTIPNRDVLRGKSAYVRSLYLAICDYADEDGVCFPSMRTLAKSAGMSLDKTQKTMSELEELGLLVKVSRSHDKNPKQKISNVYQLLLIEGVPSGSTGVYRPTVQGIPQDDTGGIPSHSTELNTDITKPKELSAGAQENELLDFFVKNINPHLKFNNKTERKACADLIAKYGLEETKKAADFVFTKQKTDQYVPKVTTPYELWTKWAKLKIYFESSTNKAASAVII